MGNKCCTAARPADADVTGKNRLEGKAKGEGLAMVQANGNADVSAPRVQPAKVKTFRPVHSLSQAGEKDPVSADATGSDDGYWTCGTSLSGVDVELDRSTDGGSKEVTPHLRSPAGKQLRPEGPHGQRGVPARGPQGGANHHKGGGQHPWQHRIDGHGPEEGAGKNGRPISFPEFNSVDNHVRLTKAPAGSQKRMLRSLTGSHKKRAVQGQDAHCDSVGASLRFASVRSFFSDVSTRLPWRRSAASLDTIDQRYVTLPLPPGSRRLVRPVAGSTLVKYPLAALQPGGVAETDHCFSVRGENYFRDKKKLTSKQPGYKLLGADVFAAEKKIPHIVQYLQLPDVPAALAKVAGDLPPLLVINCQVPSYAPSLFGGTDNGDGCSLVFYFMLDEEFAKQQDSPEFQLAKRFLARSDEHRTSKDGRSKVRDQLKLVARFVNENELEMSSLERNLIYSYNEKPALSRPQHCFFQAEAYLEIDIDVHRFSYLALKGLHSSKGWMGQVIMDVGFVIQGNDKRELPERMLATVRMSKLPVFTSGNILEVDKQVE